MPVRACAQEAYRQLEVERQAEALRNAEEQLYVPLAVPVLDTTPRTPCDRAGCLIQATPYGPVPILTAQYPVLTSTSYCPLPDTAGTAH